MFIYYYLLLPSLYIVTALNSSRLQVSKLFDEPLLSLSLHPRGHILLVGFTTCLKLLNIFSDDIQSFRVFPIAPCIVVSEPWIMNEYMMLRNLIEVETHSIIQSQPKLCAIRERWFKPKDLNLQKLKIDSLIKYITFKDLFIGYISRLEFIISASSKF